MLTLVKPTAWSQNKIQFRFRTYQCNLLTYIRLFCTELFFFQELFCKYQCFISELLDYVFVNTKLIIKFIRRHLNLLPTQELCVSCSTRWHLNSSLTFVFCSSGRCYKTQQWEKQWKLVVVVVSLFQQEWI